MNRGHHRGNELHLVDEKAPIPAGLLRNFTKYGRTDATADKACRYLASARALGSEVSRVGKYYIRQHLSGGETYLSSLATAFIFVRLMCLGGSLDVSSFSKRFSQS